jgi:tetratricopeptide (TPR) repeat protein
MPGPIENAQGLLARGRPAEAYAVVQHLLAREPNNLKGHFLAAAAAGRMGRKAEALDHLGRCRRSLSQGAGQVNGYLQLAKAYERVGAPVEALGLLENAVRLAPGEAAIRVELSDLLLRQGRYDEAAAAARRAAAEQPGNASAWSTLGAAEHKAGRCDAALEAYRRAQALKPDWTFLNNNIAAAAIAAGDPDSAIDTARRWLTAEPGNAEALSFLALALHEAGRPEEARDLLDFDRLVKCYTFDPPAGFTDTGAFNDALEEHVLSHPTLKTPKIDEPTYHHPALRISENLLEGDKGPLESLEELMRQAVSRYREDAGDDPQHPFLAHRPDRVDIYAWGAVLEGEGNQHAHIHIDGYLSGCYYVRIPPEVSSPDNGSDGPIKGGFEVGRPPEEIGCRAEPLTRAIKPHEGLMVMFPAYLYHQTIPFKSTARRICVAFDVLPAGRKRVGH